MPVLPEQRYLEELTARLRASLREELVAVYLTGSGALGDWSPRASDLDVMVICGGRLSQRLKRDLAESVGHDALPCPARALELVVYRSEQVARPQAPIDIELNLNTGRSVRERVWFGPRGVAGHWFVIDLAIARAHGRALLGPPAPELIGAPGEASVREALAQCLAWYEREQPAGADAVLNACRAWRYGAERVWCSKRSAAAWALDRGLAGSLPARALALREEGVGELSPSECAALLRAAAARIIS